jgi:hypothetical protein
MPLIPFPNVPQVPGVPAVLRDLTIPSLSQLANIALGGLAELIFGIPPWGIYDQQGNEVLQPDTFLGIRFKNGARIADFPMEAGSFSSYNKVQTPFDAAVRMSLGGDTVSRAQFLVTIEALLQTTDLYSVVTPEISYPSVNLVNYSYSRQQRNGAAMIVVDLMFEEVRQSAMAQFAQVQDPSGASPVNDGQVQAYPIPATGSLQTGTFGTDIR